MEATCVATDRLALPQHSAVIAHPACVVNGALPTQTHCCICHCIDSHLSWPVQALLSTLVFLLQAMKQDADQDQESYKNFIVSNQILETTIVDADYHSTLCMNCQTVCHDHCNLDEMQDAGKHG